MKSSHYGAECPTRLARLAHSLHEGDFSFVDENGFAVDISIPSRLAVATEAGSNASQISGYLKGEKPLGAEKALDYFRILVDQILRGASLGQWPPDLSDAVACIQRSAPYLYAVRQNAMSKISGVLPNSPLNFQCPGFVPPGASPAGYLAYASTNPNASVALAGAPRSGVTTTLETQAARAVFGGLKFPEIAVPLSFGPDAYTDTNFLERITLAAQDFFELTSKQGLDLDSVLNLDDFPSWLNKMLTLLRNEKKSLRFYFLELSKVQDSTRNQVLRLTECLSAHPSGDAISTHLDLGGVGLESLRSEVLPPHVAIKTPPLFVEQQVRALAAKYPKAANSYREIFADYGGNPYLTQIGVAVKADRLSLEVGKKLFSDQVKVVQAWWGPVLDAEIRSQLKRDSIVDLGPHNLLLTGSGFFRFVSEVDFARPKISISTEFLRNLLLE